MPLFSSAQIARSAEEAESLFFAEYPCIVERVSLAIVADTAEYTLSSSVHSIRKILWLGRRLDPLTHDTLRQWNTITWSGKPDSYAFTDLGQLKIRFYPIPNETIAANQTNLWVDTQRDVVLVEYYRLPDFDTYTIPAYIRRRLLKAYVVARRYAAEGKGKNLKAADYFMNKWDMLKARYGDIMTDVMMPPKLFIGDNYSRSNRMIINRGPNFGTPVDFGE